METFIPFDQVSVTILSSTTTSVDVVVDAERPAITSTPPFPGRLQRQVAVPSSFTLSGVPLTSDPRTDLSRSTSDASSGSVTQIGSLPIRFNSEGAPQWDTFFRENHNWLESVARAPRTLPLPQGFIQVPPLQGTLPLPQGFVQTTLQRARYYDETYVSPFRIGGEGMEEIIDYDDTISPELAEVCDLFSGA